MYSTVHNFYRGGVSVVGWIEPTNLFEAGTQNHKFSAKFNVNTKKTAV